MGKILAGAAIAAGVYYGLKYLASHSGSHTPAPENPPPQPVEVLPAGDAGVP